MKKKIVTILAVLLLATVLFAQGGAETKGVVKFKLAENQPANNPISKGMLMFADLVKEKTGGSVQIEVYMDEIGRASCRERV